MCRVSQYSCRNLRLAPLALMRNVYIATSVNDLITHLITFRKHKIL
jgi:hypothetical protein